MGFVKDLLPRYFLLLAFLQYQRLQACLQPVVKIYFDFDFIFMMHRHILF